MVAVACCGRTVRLSWLTRRPGTGLAHMTPLSSSNPDHPTCGVRILTVFPSPPRGENGEGPWSSTETPHPLRDLTTHLGRADTTGAGSCATEDGSGPRR